MEQRALGRIGVTVSALGFGCGAVGGLMVKGSPREQLEAVSRALEAGITYFDTAALYGSGRSEENLGHVLRELDAWDRVTVGTKVRLADEDRGDFRAALRRSLLASLERLGRNSVDLLQLHNHITSGPAAERGGVTLSETLDEIQGGMRALVDEGLVRHIGITGLGETEAVAGVLRSGGFETVQSYFSAANPSAGYAGASAGAQDFGGLIDQAAAKGIGVIAIRVLAGGALTGSSERAAHASPAPAALARGADFEGYVLKAHSLTDLAREAGLSGTVELAVRFALSKPEVSTVLVGYSTIDHLEDAIAWAEAGPISPDTVAAVVAAAR